MSASVVVVVLSYNGTADTLACLDSLQQEPERTFDILVVDNASTDGAPAAIRARYPEIKMVELPENRGWAGGNNVGIRQALDGGAELVCLLNNDTIVPAGSIAALADAARRHTPCLMHPAIDYSDPAEGAQLDPSKSIPPSGVRQLGIERDVFELDFAYGACLMIPTKVFRQIGIFDERFFLQMEEMDFWLRARRVGILSLCTTSARIVHAESRSFGARDTPLKTYYIVRNTLLLTEKHNRTPGGILRALRKLYWNVSRVAKLRDGRMSTSSVLSWFASSNPFMVAARKGFTDYLLRRFGHISAVGFRAINDATQESAR